MKGLLLKDFYMIKKYCKMYFFMMAIFVAASAFADGDNLFFVFYPSMLSGLIPVTLLGYDERSGWDKYSGTLPYTKAQIVSGKYIIGLALQLLIIFLIGIIQTVKMGAYGTLDSGAVHLLVALLFIVSCVSSSLCLPFMFKYGVEKGRIAYYIMIGAICAGSFVASSVFTMSLNSHMRLSAALPVVCTVAAVVYGISWYLSVVFYKKREI